MQIIIICVVVVALILIAIAISNSIIQSNHPHEAGTVTEVELNLREAKDMKLALEDAIESYEASNGPTTAKITTMNDHIVRLRISKIR